MVWDGFFGWALAFVIVFRLPFVGQLLGYLSYSCIKNWHDSIAHFFGVLLPPIVFFLHLRWLTEPTDLTGKEGLILAVGGTALQFLFAIAIQAALHHHHKANHNLPRAV